MNVALKNTDDVNAIVTVTVSKDDYAEKVEKKLKEYRRKANVPGFRPGMVPMGLVKKMYGKAVTAEEVNGVLSDALYNYIKEHLVDYENSKSIVVTESFPKLNSWSLQ